MCSVLKVSVSGYYYWLMAPVGPRAKSRIQLVAEIKSVYQESKGRYGSPKITSCLRRRGLKASMPLIARIMRKEHIRSIVCRKYRIQTTDSSHRYKIAENVLSRDLHAEKTGQKWVSDLNYIRTAMGWLYLTIMMDLADRKIIGWALSITIKALDTSVADWRMAIKNRPIIVSLLFHSDQGFQFACPEFRNELELWPVVQSMSRKGNCWDNSVAESFFKTLKTELIYQTDYATIKEAERAIFEYIEVDYNRNRIHSTLDYHTPEAYQAILTIKRELA